jgi:integrase
MAKTAKAGNQGIQIIEERQAIAVVDGGVALGVPAGSTARLGVAVSARQWALSAHAAIVAQRSDHSRRAYERALREFSTWLFRVDASGVDKAEFWNWLVAATAGPVLINKTVVVSYSREVLEARLSPVAVGVHLAAIRRALREGADADWFDANDRERLEAAARFQGPKVDQMRPTGRRLTKEEVSRFLLSCSRRAESEGTLRAAQDEVIAYLLALAGLRRSEVAGLRWDSIQIDEGRPVLLVEGKGGKVRTVAIPAPLMRALDRCKARLLDAGGSIDGALLHRIDRHHNLSKLALKDSGVESSLDRSLELAGAGVEGVNPHDLRRTFARAARQAGVSLDELREALGHASIITTDRYSRLGQDLSTGRAVGDRVASFWAV